MSIVFPPIPRLAVSWLVPRQSTILKVHKHFLGSYHPTKKTSNRQPISRMKELTIPEELLPFLPSNGYFDFLPEAILLLIFTHFDYKELVQISAVSKLFHTVSSSSFLWEIQFQLHYEASYKVIKYLGRKGQTQPEERHWKLEFVRKASEWKCSVCGVVCNFFNRSQHTHKTNGESHNHSQNGKRKSSESNIKPPNPPSKLNVRTRSSGKEQNLVTSMPSPLKTPIGLFEDEVIESSETASHGIDLPKQNHQLPKESAIEVITAEEEDDKQDYVYRRKSKYRKKGSNIKSKRSLFDKEQ